MALAPPHMQRPDAPVNPMPPGMYPPPGAPMPPGAYPPGSQYERFPRGPQRRRGTARKTDVSEEALEAHDMLAQHTRGEHWQRSRGRRDALIFGIGFLCVAGVLVVAFIPDKYLGIKRVQPPTTAEEKAPPKPALAPSMSSQEILDSQSGRTPLIPGPSTAKRPLTAEETPDEERKRIVAEALREAQLGRSEIDTEMNNLKETMPGFEPPNATTPAPRTPAATAPPEASAPPVPARPRKSKQELDAEIDRQTQEMLHRMSQEKKIEPVAPPPPPAVSLAPAPSAPPRATPAPAPGTAAAPGATPAPPRAQPATRP
jgi:hypothetical protein